MHLGAAAAGGLGDRPPHAAARAVADVAHRVDRLAGARRRSPARAGRPASPAAAPGAPRPRRRSRRARPAAPRRPRRRRAGPSPAATTWTPRATQRREVVRPWPGAGPHARVHGRGDHHRPVEGEVDRAEQPVAEARGHPGDRVGRGRRDQQQVGAAGQLEVVVARAAPRRRTGRPRPAGPRARRRWPGRRSAGPPAVMTTVTPWPAPLEDAHDVDRLVGGDAAGDAQERPQPSGASPGDRGDRRGELARPRASTSSLTITWSNSSIASSSTRLVAQARPRSRPRCRWPAAPAAARARRATAAR